MGKRGPTPDRTGRDSHGRDVAPELENLEPPHYLDLDAVGVWHRIAPSLAERGILTEWDVETLAVFCTAVVVYRRAILDVNDRGVLIGGRRSSSERVKNPALQIARDQAGIIAMYAARFGLTPADRAKLRLDEPDHELEGGGVDPFA